jgi:SAM-dependent methyltransferase
VKRALDLGCGSGTVALLLARSASAVVGTDINPRAVAMARINAAMNGARGVEFREGDRFAPVEGETFDLIASQPPFVPRPSGADASAALYGGARGDELPLSVLAGVPKHLARGGRAVLLVEWPEVVDGAPLEERLRAALGPAANLLVLRAPASDMAAEAVGYAAGLYPHLGPAFEADALARLSHLERRGVRELTPTIVVVERSAEQGPARGGWTAVVPVEPLASMSMTSERVDKMLAARALTCRGEASLLGATLRVPEGTVLSQVQVGPGAEVPSTLSARFSPRVGLRAIDLTLELLFLVTVVHEATTVCDALPRCAEVLRIPVDEARPKVLAAVAEALDYGFLEIVGAPSAVG